MLDKYKVVYKGGQDEIIEKKSRFIATVAPVESEEEALAFIEAMKKKYWDARHNCFAYVIGERGQLARCSDDGEPGGTAGKTYAGCSSWGRNPQYSSCCDPLLWRNTSWNRRACKSLFFFYTGGNPCICNYNQNPGA